MRGALLTRPRGSTHAQSGVALLLSALLGVALLGGWMLAWRATHDTVRTERYLVARGERAAFVARALADGVARLETGLPPSDPFECLVGYPSSPRPVYCRITYTGLGGLDWDVSVRQATPAEVAALPSLPLSF